MPWRELLSVALCGGEDKIQRLSTETLAFLNRRFKPLLILHSQIGAIRDLKKNRMDNHKSNAPRERPEAAEAEYVGANCCQLRLVGSSGEWWGETIYRF